MNKDVVYIEPEDDITDIISKIENAKAKIVALVVPKKADIFRSAVNVKLMAKTSAEAKKNVVLVTTEPSIIKLAAIAKLPVTKDLKTVPTVPEIEDADLKVVEIKDEKEPVVEDEDAEEAEETDEEAEAEDEEATESEEETKEESEEESEAEVKEDEEKSEEKAEPKKDDKKKEKSDKKADKKKSSKDGGILGWIKNHKLIVILTPIIIILLVLVLFWAFVIAPAVSITVTIRTVKNNFSENISFTTKLEEEDAKAGKFYLEEKKLTTPVKVEFKATGTKNIGEKAKGEVVAFIYFANAASISIPQGSTFSKNGLFYTSNQEVTLSWDGKSFDPCENINAIEDFVKEKSCLITASVPITANGSGSSYNVAPSNDGWAANVGVGVYSVSEIAGGTDRTITVIQQSDIDAAKESLTSPANETENRAALLASIGEDVYKIESSFRQSVGEITSSPALDEEVKEGVTPTLSTNLTSSIFVLDLTKVKEYIAETAKVTDKNRIYDIEDPFVESFTSTETGYAGRLKTVYTVGPNISAESILESVKGEPIGKIKPVITDLSGQNSTAVTIDRSFPWVNSVPNDPNKINIEIVTEE
ncbi:MAG: hypothetical protein K6G36_00055 [Candidatus Saccharibacteria bacterium]|nr:hypothetical protein [Candidatus Saccharibacteria bacterium]